METVEEDAYSELFQELKAKGCTKGCGGCCLLVTLSYKKVKKIEENLSQSPPQFPGKEFFKYDYSSKDIVIKHRDGEATLVDDVCPFLYVADINFNAIENWKVKIRGYTRVNDPGKIIYDRAEIVLDGPKDFTLLCGIHEEIRSNRTIGKILKCCKKWVYNPKDREDLINKSAFCRGGVKLYAKRIDSARQ